MIAWATKRKAIYLSIVLGTLFLILSVYLFSIFNTPPTCFDGIQNQGELGVDCGGPCELRCDFQITQPSVLWSRVFEVSPGFYSAAAYVRNPNINSQTRHAPYKFTIYDDSGDVLVQREGATFIPAGKTFVVFESGFNISEARPDRASFEFTGRPEWYLDTDDREIETFVSRKQISRLDTAPRVDSTIQNRSIFNIPELEVVAIVYDGEGNAAGVSRTVRSISSGGSTQAVFTWPRPFEVEENICGVPVDVMMVIDRSGSMVFDNWDLENPEPMTSAKSAAAVFLDNLQDNSMVGLASFATEASLDHPISGNHNEVRDSIENIRIEALTPEEVWTQHTNITHGLELALSELERDIRQDSEKFVILFTDGIPTHPVNEEDPDYPSVSAIEMANEIKNSGIEIYSIGLGEEQIDKDFLLEISSSPEHHFSTSDVGNLVEIYEEVATDICRNEASVIEIITRVIPQ